MAMTAQRHRAPLSSNACRPRLRMPVRTLPSRWAPGARRKWPAATGRAPVGT